jgi:hypothetical protein
MGQFGNQPEFATTVDIVSSLSSDVVLSKPSAVFIGAVTQVTGNTLIVVPVGNSSYNPSTGVTTNTPVTLTGLQSGTFLPIMITSIISSGTTVPAASILLYR